MVSFAASAISTAVSSDAVFATSAPTLALTTFATASVFTTIATIATAALSALAALAATSPHAARCA